MRSRSGTTSFPTFAIALVLGALAAGSAGCLAAAAPEDDAREFGQIELPLIETAPDGSLYRLRGAVYEITTANDQVIVLDAGNALARATAAVPPGLASLRLRAGWTLEHSTDGESFAAVEALYVTPNPYIMRVTAGVSSTLRVDFLVRSPSGNFSVVLGVSEPSHQLGGDLFVEEATGALAPYLHETIDFATYFDVWRFDRVVEEDGSKSLVYRTYRNATELFDDEHGVLDEQLAPGLVSGTFELRLTAKTSGEMEVRGSSRGYWNGSLTFESGQAWGQLELDAEGFPMDGPFAASLGFTAQLPDAERSTMSGQMFLNKIDLDAAP